jgi:hypothetical protein
MNPSQEPGVEHEDADATIADSSLRGEVHGLGASDAIDDLEGRRRR